MTDTVGEEGRDAFKVARETTTRDENSVVERFVD
jgi:hypothetical protein